MHKYLFLFLMCVISKNSIAVTADEREESDGFEELIELLDYLQANKDLGGLNMKDVAKQGKCKKVHNLIEKKARSNKRLQSLLHGSIAEECNKDFKMAAAYYSLAVEAGSIFAKKQLEKIERRTARRTAMIDLDEFRVDIALMLGHEVIIGGVGQYVMDNFFLKNDIMDMNPVSVDISEVPRHQRLDLVEKCGSALNICNVIVSGTVGQISRDYVIFANDIELETY